MDEPGKDTEKRKAQIIINRPAFNNDDLRIYAGFEKRQITMKEWIKLKAKELFSVNFVKVLFNFFPFLEMFTTYQCSYFLNDFLAGLTVGIMHIPQGMAYGMLANLPPVYGLYTSFFSVIVYFFFGKSPHISIGTFALVSMMVGSSVNKVCQNVGNPSNSTLKEQCHIEGAITLSLMVGVAQFLMAILYLGAVAQYISTPVIRGFTSGSAILIFTSQLTSLFGFSLDSDKDSEIWNLYIEFFASITRTNILALFISILCVIIFFLVKIFVNPRVSPYLKTLVPIEFIMLVLATVVSYTLSFQSTFGVPIVGFIPKGLPTPQLPNLNLNFIQAFLTDSFALAIISFVTVYAMAQTFAIKEGYHIKANFELFAISMSNIVASFFTAYASSASVSRSFVQYNCGAKTQITNLISCLLILSVLMFFAPLFYHLPKCVLASIVVVNLSGAFKQFADLRFHFKFSILDGVVWMLTFVGVVFLNVVFGLLIGVFFSIFFILKRNQNPSLHRLARIPETECYGYVKKFKNHQEILGVGIYRLESSLNFSNQTKFKETLLDVVNSASELTSSAKIIGFTVKKNYKTLEDKVLEYNDRVLSEKLSHVVLDFSCVPFIDADGIRAIDEVSKAHKAMNISLHLTGCNDSLLETLKNLIKNQELAEIGMYPTVHDAVVTIQNSL